MPGAVWLTKHSMCSAMLLYILKSAVDIGGGWALGRGVSDCIEAMMKMLRVNRLPRLEGKAKTQYLGITNLGNRESELDNISTERRTNARMLKRFSQYYTEAC